MTDEELYDLVAAGVFALIVGLLLTITLSVSARAVRWYRQHKNPPILLYRDLFGFTGLSTSVLMTSAARASDIPPQYLKTIPWLIATSIPAILGLVVFLYFELFVIGRD
jgi:hypothetical protein